MDKHPVITLLTDFKIKDGYAGIMKGVIFSINPQCQIIDLAHEVSPQMILEAAFILGYSYRYFPRGSIHMVVVDPGVGGERRPIVVETKENLFVGPDNGVFTYIYQEADSVRVFELARREYFLSEVGNTFHGRDIFSPVAARLSLGIAPEKFGDEIKDFIKKDIPEIRANEREINGEIIYADGFGNLVTNISVKMITDFTRGKIFDLIVGKKRINGILKCYYDAGEGELLAIFGSSGYLEISVNKGSARLELNADRGDSVRIVIN